MHVDLTVIGLHVLPVLRSHCFLHVSVLLLCIAILLLLLFLFFSPTVGLIHPCPRESVCNTRETSARRWSMRHGHVVVRLDARATSTARDVTTTSPDVYRQRTTRHWSTPTSPSSTPRRRRRQRQQRQPLRAQSAPVSDSRPTTQAAVRRLTSAATVTALTDMLVSAAMSPALFV